MTRRCERNRKRSKRRAIFCPLHLCYMDSVSPKYAVYADRPEHLQQQGINRLNSQILVAAHTTVPLKGQWIECFWCDECQATAWYHVWQHEREFILKPASQSEWQRATGVINPDGNPSVGEFTRRQARMGGVHGLRQYRWQS